MIIIIIIRRPDLVLINKKKSCRHVDFTVLSNQRVKMIEIEKVDKHLDLEREQIKLWKIMVKPFIIRALETVPKRFKKRTRKIDQK